MELIGGLNAGRFRGQKMRDNQVYRAAKSLRNRPRHPVAGDSPMTTAADPQIVPPPAGRGAGIARCRPGRRLRPGVRPLQQHQARLSDPVEAFRRMVRRDGPAVPAGGAPHRSPLPGRPRQHRHPAPGHIRRRQGPRVGRPRIALPGPGRASLKGDDRRELPLKGSLHSTAALAPSLDRPAAD